MWEGSHFVVLCCALATVNIVIIHQVYFIGTEVIVIEILKDLSRHNNTKNPWRNNGAQVEWWLEHRHGWLVKRQWAGSILGWVSRDEYQVLGSTSIPARLDTLVYWEPFSWLTSVGTTRNTVIRLGWSRIGLAVLILHAAGVGLTDRPAVISGRYYKYHSLQLQNYYAHLPPLQHTHIHANTTMRNWSWEWSWVSRHCMLAVSKWWQEESCVIG